MSVRAGPSGAERGLISRMTAGNAPATRSLIHQLMVPFLTGLFPVRVLSVPLVSSTLSTRRCPLRSSPSASRSLRSLLTALSRGP